MMFVFGVLIFAAFVSLTKGWTPSARFLRWWRSKESFVAAYLRTAPAVFIYLAILIVTTTIYLESSPPVRRAMLRERSTNLSHLTRDPIHVLISSAFWIGGANLVWNIALFALVLAPMERWLGSLRLIVSFFGGHVGATLITGVGLYAAIEAGRAPRNLERAIDVGVSYGTYCCCALFTYRLPRPWLFPWALAWAGFGFYGILAVGDFTAYGHLATILLGFAMYPITRSATAQARTQAPLWRVPVPVPRQHIDVPSARLNR